MSVGALVGATESQMPSLQLRLAQSSPDVHGEPPPQPWQLPPQSTSVSSPLFTPSRQKAGVGFIVGDSVGATESHIPSLQLKLAQSSPDVHEAPPPQPWQLPPQSTSVSSPLLTPSMQ